MAENEVNRYSQSQSQTPVPAHEGMTIADLLGILRKHVITILITFIVTMIAVAGWTMVLPVSYTSEAQLFAAYNNSSSDSSVSEQNIGSSYIMSQIKSYPTLAKTQAVLQPVIDQLHLDTSVEELANSVNVSNPANTSFINISAKASNPQESAQMANAVASSLSRVVEKSLYSGESASSVKLSIVQPAQQPSKPSSPKWSLSILAGIVGGLVLGVFVAFLKDVLSKKIEDGNEISEYIDAPIIGRIPEDELLNRKTPVIISEPGSPIAEDYRRIRTNLSFIAPAENGNCRLIVVTSTGASEGKTTSSVNIATALAENGARVLLIDADLRHPSVANKIDLDGSAGLTHVLSGQASVKDVIQRYWKANLHIMPAGPKPPNASALLNSPIMTELLNNAMEQYDYVIVDTAPMVVANDAVTFMRQGGSLIMVCRRDQTLKHDLRDIAQELDALDMTTTGIVFNCAKENKKALENSNYYYYSNNSAKSNNKKSWLKRK